MWELIAGIGLLIIKMWGFNKEKKIERRKKWLAAISRKAGRPVLSAKAHDEYENSIDNFDKEPDSDS